MYKYSYTFSNSNYNFASCLLPCSYLVWLNWNWEDILSSSSFSLSFSQLCSYPVEGSLSFSFLCLTPTPQRSVHKGGGRERERERELSLDVWNSWADIATITPLPTVLPQSLSVEKGYYLLQTEDSFYRSQEKERMRKKEWERKKDKN